MVTIIVERAGEDEVIEVEKLSVGDCFFSGDELFLKCTDNYKNNGGTIVTDEEDFKFFVWAVSLHSNRITQFSRDRMVTKVEDVKVVIGK